jgi:ATPase subunit of ABC transporter with duplicated ATPase domains
MRDLKPEATIFDEVADGEEWIDIGGAQPVHVRAYLAAFSFKGDMQNRLVGDLSGGERNRVHLAKMLKQGCNVIMLDEPSNDLDVDTLRSLEEALVEFAGS